jgi:peptidoglycan/xylan/chitin deacetylase (PgdA/CDA1 family)
VPGRLTALSVDLDEVHHYRAIHGLCASPRGEHAAYDRALARIDAFARAHELPVTFFAVGDDLARPESAAGLRALAARGHAVESHSRSHRYDLTRLDRASIHAEIEGGARAIEAAIGARPTGFRAPGYAVSDAVLDALEASGAAWDSSVFPSPPYFAAKAAALAWMRLLGRASRAVLDTPRVLVAPRRPYHPGERWDRPGKRVILELPIQVTPGLRLPVIGTSVGLAGPRGARLLARLCAREPLVNLELHAMDFLEPADGLDDLRPHQPELAASLADRVEALSAFVAELRARGHALVRLDEAAAALGAAVRS